MQGSEDAGNRPRPRRRSASGGEIVPAEPRSLSRRRSLDPEETEERGKDTTRSRRREPRRVSLVAEGEDADQDGRERGSRDQNQARDSADGGGAIEMTAAGSMASVRDTPGPGDGGSREPAEEDTRARRGGLSRRRRPAATSSEITEASSEPPPAASTSRPVEETSEPDSADEDKAEDAALLGRRGGRDRDSGGRATPGPSQPTPGRRTLKERLASVVEATEEDASRREEGEGGLAAGPLPVPKRRYYPPKNDPTPGYHPRMTSLTNTEVASHAVLQMLIFVNQHALVGWFVAALVAAGTKDKVELLSVLVVIVYGLLEPLRLLAGATGNLEENVAYLIIFLFFTLFPQLGLCAYLVIIQSEAERFDKALSTALGVLLIAEMVAGIAAARKIIASQTKKFYLEDFNDEAMMMMMKTPSTS